MSVTPSRWPAVIQGGIYALSEFDALMAPMVASWVQHQEALFWLAPTTQHPLTPGKVVAWTGQDASPLLFWREKHDEPLGYLELNLMPQDTNHYWLGHCLIRPEARSQGLGYLMVRLMLEEAFRHRQAERVSLVVFPENRPALRCYHRIGFHQAGFQVKYFQTTGRQHRMIRMTLSRSGYDTLDLPPELRDLSVD